MTLDYESLLTRITSDAGDLIMNHRRHYGHESMKAPGELVTPADIASNDQIIKELRAATPHIPIYSEEGFDHKSESLTRWIVDPLDGTTPWVWGNSGFSVSVALELDGVIELGAVYDPVMRELFYAQRNHGARRNGEPIRTRQRQLANALLTVDWGNASEYRAAGLAYFAELLTPQMQAERVVPQFAPALGLCRIAEGRVDGLVCNDTWTEDHSAGALILSEAGGAVSNFSSERNFDHRQAGIIAAGHTALHSELQTVVLHHH
jgi:myo-inositol-1(or 4)-monophosphatase